MSGRPVDWTPLAGADPVPGDPEAVAALAVRYRHTAEAIEQAAVRLRHLGLVGWWHSDAGLAFAAEARRTSDSILCAFRRYDETARALANYAPHLAEAQHDADRALAQAKDAAADLSRAQAAVRGSDPPDAPDHDQNAHRRAVDDASAALEGARRRLDRAIALRDSAADRAASSIELISALDGLHSPLQLSAATLARIQPPPPGTDPAAVRRWWESLTPEEQRDAILLHAGEVGRMDGLPAWARSAANELLLDEMIRTLQQRIAGQQPWNPMGPNDNAIDPADEKTLEGCLRIKAELERVRNNRDPQTLQPLVAQLLIFEPGLWGGQGRAAIVVGDLDSADNVAVCVPGLTSDVPGYMDNLMSNSLNLYAEARNTGGKSTAVVAWMGYDAPGFDNVASQNAAEHGALLLRRDILAIQASRAVDPHLTLIGHSYGSTTVGIALRGTLPEWRPENSMGMPRASTGTDAPLPVDDVVLFGSPGPGVWSVGDLRAPAGHVYVGANSRDTVSYLDRFGLDPTHERFGAIRFQAEDPTRVADRLSMEDHSKYYGTNTESLFNIAAVVNGDYGRVVPAPYRDEIPWFADGIRSDSETYRTPTRPHGP